MLHPWEPFCFGIKKDPSTFWQGLDALKKACQKFGAESKVIQESQIDGRGFFVGSLPPLKINILNTNMKVWFRCFSFSTRWLSGSFSRSISRVYSVFKPPTYTPAIWRRDMTNDVFFQRISFQIWVNFGYLYMLNFTGVYSKWFVKGVNQAMYS